MFAKLSVCFFAFTCALALSALMTANPAVAAPTSNDGTSVTSGNWNPPDGHHHNGDDSWYDQHVAWTGDCPNYGQDGEVFYNKEILWTNYATNGHLACGRRHPDDRYNGGYFVAVDASYGESKCGHVIKLQHGNNPPRCGVVIETGARDNGLLLSPAFFSQYNDPNQGNFHGDWNFIETW